jgi:DNA-binding NarL/FixJ family response regulator
MRIVVVDDQPAQLEGRIAWLSRLPGVEVKGFTFEQAAAYGPAWTQVQVAVLDGHDRRSPKRRAETAKKLGVPALPEHDNYLGVRVAAAIREHSDRTQTRIILISVYARESAVLARRIAQAGVDYVFEHHEVERDAETFIRAVIHPETFSPTERPIDWTALGYTGEPDIAGAITTVENSAAGAILLDDEPLKRHQEQAWSFRTLRNRLNQLLRGHVPPDSGVRTNRAPRKAWLAEQLRKAFGKDLPVDPY